MKNTVTFKREARGTFEVYLNGVKTEYGVHNGCLGLSGRDTPNLYLVSRGDQPTRLSGLTLQGAKKAVTYILLKQAKEAK